MKFQALGLPEMLCHALTQNQIIEPTAVQNGAIPVVLAGRDLISSARTGSGKTLAYALPVMTRLLADKSSAALVLVPTREIGVQVQQVMQPYLRALGIPLATLIIGGVSFGPQIRNLKSRPPVIIATPGRLNDHLANSGGKLRLDHVQALVLDEADRMLDMGFLPQVKQILKHLRAERQTLLFSATMPADLARACKDMLREPERVAVDSPNIANVDIEQRMQEVTIAGKQDALIEALNSASESALVFTRTKRRTDRVAQYLDEYGVRAERIHGDRSQAQRQKAIELFRGGKVKVLVATDIAARGLDIPLVELVINYDLPEGKEDYVHRIGRTGRAGAQGIALTFVTPEERGHWASISGQKRDGRSAPEGARAGGASRASQGHQQRGGAPSHSSRPFGRSERRERPAQRDRERSAEGATKVEIPSREPREASSPHWSKPQQKEWKDRPKRQDWSEQPPKRSEWKPREERAPRSGERGTRRTQFQTARTQPDQTGRPSRFQRWGQPRAERNPKHIFTGREGDEQNNRGSRNKPRFGGHGHSAPPSAGGSPRGRWRNRSNTDQPSR